MLVKFHSKMELSTSQKGFQKLLYEVYSYTKKRTTKSSIHWRCSQKSSLTCDGSLITDLNVCLKK